MTTNSYTTVALRDLDDDASAAGFGDAKRTERVSAAAGHPA